MKYAHIDIRIDAANSIYGLFKGKENNKIKGEISMQCIYTRPQGEIFYFNGVETVVPNRK